MTINFHYEARAASGRIERGALEAKNENDALARLRARDLTPFMLKPAGNVAERGPLRLNVVAARDLSRTLAQLLRAGLSFAQALRFAGEELAPIPAAAAQRMREAAERGDPVSSALDDFGGVEARLLRGVVLAGETSGRLAEALEVAAISFARSADLRARTLSALIYPSFVICATLATLASFLLLVVPALGQAFLGAEDRLPASTRALMQLSAVLRANGGWLAAAMALFVAAIITNRTARVALGRFRDVLLVSPLGLGIAQRLDFAAFANLASLALIAGVPAPAAFEAAAQATRNTHIHPRLLKAVADIRVGERPSRAFERWSAPPKSFIRLAHLGEETGKLGETLRQAATLLSGEAERRLERLGAIAGPVVTLFLGAMVGAIVLALFLGLLSLSDIATA